MKSKSTKKHYSSGHNFDSVFQILSVTKGRDRYGYFSMDIQQR